MSSGLRYKNPVICEHLANQYVAGSITPQVRARIETLCQTVPELDRAITAIADSFAHIHWQLPSTPIQSDDLDQLWSAIDQALPDIPFPSTPLQPATDKPHFWNNLLFWKFTTGLGMAMSVGLAIMLTPMDNSVDNLVTTDTDFTLHSAIDEKDQLQTAIQPQALQGPSYLATMSAYNDPEMAVQFVISAYSKQQGQPSRLHLQWSESHAGKKTHPPLHLWAEDRDSKEITYIGLQPPTEKSWDLNKTTWTAIANSSRLFMTTNDLNPTAENLAFSGECLQLKPWKKHESV